MRTRSNGFTGLAAWSVQRASAVGMLAFAIFLLATFAFRRPFDYAQWSAWVRHPGVTASFVVFFAALLGHMWVGLRDVLLDYAKPPALQRFLLGVVGTGLAVIAAWVLWILLP